MARKRIVMPNKGPVILPRITSLVDALLNLELLERATYIDHSVIADRALELLAGAVVLSEERAPDELSRRILGVLGAQEHFRKETPKFWERIKLPPLAKS